LVINFHSKTRICLITGGAEDEEKKIGDGAGSGCSERPVSKVMTMVAFV